MKIIYKLLLIVVICLLFTGCDGTVTRSFRHAGFNLSNDFKCDKVMPENKKDKSYLRIKYIVGNYMVLADGTLYELSLGQPFANKQNCKIADTDKKVVSLFDSSYFKGNDDKYYYLSTNGDTPSYSEMPNTDNSYPLVDLLLNDANNVKVVTGNSSAGEYYVLKNSGDVYKYVIQRDDATRVEQIKSTNIFYDKKNYGGMRILDFGYAGDSLNTFVKTENKVFRMKITNADQCNKYADIVCKYAMEEDEIFQEYRDRVIFYNGNLLIVDYGRTFTVAF